MRVVVTAGGTGGHIFPALALSAEFKNMGHTVLFIGGLVGPEAAMARDAGIDFLGVDVRGFDRKDHLKTLLAVARLPRAVARAVKILKVFAPDAVVGAGGYASGPGCLAAVFKGAPLFLLEQNVFPGLVTRRMARAARRVYVSFEGSARWLKGADVMTAGNPARAEFEFAPQRNFGAREKTVLIIGGSQGARSINNAVMAALPQLKGMGLRIFHQTGKRQAEEVRAAYRLAGVDAVVEPFFSNMAELMRWSHLTVSRAGASTCSELALSALPSLMVPFPGAGGHQKLNAEEMEKCGAAKVVDDAGLGGETLAAALGAILNDRQTLERMSEGARKCARPNAARTIAADICGIVEGGK